MNFGRLSSNALLYAYTLLLALPLLTLKLLTLLITPCLSSELEVQITDSML